MLFSRMTYGLVLALCLALPAGAQARVLRDLPYGGDAAQTLDVYLPDTAKDAPVIVMVHGGGWRTGDKASNTVWQNKAAHWLPRGYVFVSLNTRLLPGADPLTQAGDVARALGFVQGHAKDWGGDPDQVVLMGHSAGAHLVALLGADPGRATPWRATIALDSAALDLESVMHRRPSPLLRDAFGSDPAYWRMASPQARVTGKAGPFLLVCSSERRRSCPAAQSFASHVVGQGGQAGVLPVALSHRQINETLGVPGAYTDRVDAFLWSLGLS